MEDKNSDKKEVMRLFTWGFNKYGQLGDGQNVTSEVPRRVPTGDPHSQPRLVSCGAHFTIVGLGPSLQLLSCGRGLYGRLGNGSEADQSTLKPLHYKTKEPIVSVSAGHWHGVFITSTGEVYSWGYNKSHGVLGTPDGLPDVSTIPVQVSCKVPFSHVSCGFNYTIAISTDSQSLYSWGCGKYGMLGHGDRDDRSQPTLIQSTESIRMTQVHAGYCHAGFISNEGKLYTCGKGSDGALGHKGDKNDKLLPTLVESLLEFAVDVSCSVGEHHSHTLVATKDGEVFSCGDGYKCKLGHGNDKSLDTPTKIDPAHFNGCRITSVACGGIHSVAMAMGEGVFTWGCGSDGRLGHPEAHGHRYLFLSSVPRLVEGLKDWKPLMISSSYYHTAALCCK